MVETNQKEYVYKTETNSREKFTTELKVNEIFGWELVSENNAIKAKTYRREKSEMHDSELTRLEKRIDTLIDNVIKNKKKIKKSSKLFSYIFGVVSTLVLGSGMSFIMAFAPTQLNMIIGILLSCFGAACCAINLPLYKKIALNKVSKLEPQVIENKEKIINILEQVKTLTNK